MPATGALGWTRAIRATLSGGCPSTASGQAKRATVKRATARRFMAPLPMAGMLRRAVSTVNGSRRSAHEHPARERGVVREEAPDGAGEVRTRDPVEDPDVRPPTGSGAGDDVGLS